MASVRQVASVLNGMDPYREITLEDLVTIFHLTSPKATRAEAQAYQAQASEIQKPHNERI